MNTCKDVFYKHMHIVLYGRNMLGTHMQICFMFGKHADMYVLGTCANILCVRNIYTDVL